MVMFGIDASSAQRIVDWSAVDEVTGFGFEKVTQGDGYVNPYWPEAKAALAARARTSGMIPGAYLFLEHGPSGAAQADLFAEHAGNLDGWALAIDVEPYSPPGRAPSLPTHADAIASATRLRRHYPGHPLGGYLPPWYWDNIDAMFVDWTWPSRYVSGIGGPRDLYQRVPGSYWAPYGGRAPALLQFTASAVVPGVGLVDCSAFRGAPDQLRRIVAEKGAAPPPPEPAHDWQEAMMHRLPTLKQGATAHDHVRRAQALLGPAGQKVTEDGVFGPATHAAVSRVQRAHGMTADGIIGPHTWTLLVTGAA